MNPTTFFLWSFVVLLLFHSALADIYLHAPRGSNNRNRETGVNTANANRMYDSQNNNKGGYCWGPPMTYYEGSLLQVEWTAQHACGVGSMTTDCDLILQYMCSPTLRDGFVTDTITEATQDTMATDPVTGQTVYQYGMHEPFDYYNSCSQRIRNRGLFIADQGLQNTDTAMRTRQENNQNNPHGFECEEERDYYPYWHPSPWRDIAVLTSNTKRCAYFQQHSQNVEGKFECSLPVNNNQDDCNTAGGAWSYTRPWGTPPPDCLANSFSRDNHLGNTKTGYTSSYSWVIPRLNTMEAAYLNAGGTTANCVFRIRYNISTSDYLGWGQIDSNAPMVTSSLNGQNSPVQQDPYVTYGTQGGNEWTLQLALNTDQYGRTFQDRSYMFNIAQRPSGVDPNHRIINLNVRGKRGNIVEAYPAVEYDFTPNQLILATGDFIHWQWTGCDTNPNYAGEGTQGTDRSNVVQIYDGRKNYPMPFSDQTLFPDANTAFDMAYLRQYNYQICQTADQTGCCLTQAQLQAAGNSEQNVQNCFKLNAPSAQYFNGGLVQMKNTGTYYYMSTRNNNFSNRSQKGVIYVESLLPTWGIAIASVGAIGFAGASVAAGAAYYAASHPASILANVFAGVNV